MADKPTLAEQIMRARGMEGERPSSGPNSPGIAGKDRQMLVSDGDDDNEDASYRSHGFGDWCEATTWHGVPDWYQSKAIASKICWSVIMLLVTTVLLYELYIGINDYLTRDHYVTSTYFEPAKSVRFPDIAICNANRANATKMKEVGLNEKALMYMYGIFPRENYMPFTFLPPSDVREYAKAYSDAMANYKLRPNDAQTVISNLGHTCEESMQACYFNGNPLSPCCANFIDIFTVYGRCFQLNAIDARLMDISISGKRRGLQLLINPAIELYPKTPFNNYWDQGIIMIFQMGQILNPFPQNLAVIPPGSQAQISISFSERRFDYPSQEIFKLPCLQEPSLAYFHGFYTRELCSSDCYMRGIMSACGCLLPGASRPNQSNGTVCDVETAYQCIGKSANNSDCDEFCVTDSCETTEPQVTTQITLSQFSESLATSAFKSNHSTQLFRGDQQHFSFVNVFFDSIGNQVSQTSEAMSLNGLLGSLGGQLGLWIGASIITIIQIFYFAVLRLVEYLTKPGK